MKFKTVMIDQRPGHTGIASGRSVTERTLQQTGRFLFGGNAHGSHEDLQQI